jgi:hypothetical protein
MRGDPSGLAAPAAPAAPARQSLVGSGLWEALELTALSLAGLLWASSVSWVVQDARRRLESPVLIALAAVLGAIPLAGPLAYLLLRPAELLEEGRARRLERALLDQTLSRTSPCPACAAPAEEDFLVCPLCATRLREPCEGCGSPLARNWLACPYCALPATAPANGRAPSEPPSPAAAERAAGARAGLTEA